MDGSIFFEENPFSLWSLSHGLPVLLYFLFATTVIWYAKTKVTALDKKKRILFWLSLIPFTALIVQNLIKLSIGQWTAQEDLPFHICRILALFAPLVYLKDNKFWTGVFYFWILVGTLNAVIAADIRFDFPHYNYFSYFILHIGLIPMPIYHCYILGRKIDRRDLWNTYWLANVFLLATMAINFTIESNYMFTRHKPVVASLMDHLGPWPWYLVVLQFIGLFLFCLVYLPFVLRGKSKG